MLRRSLRLFHRFVRMERSDAIRVELEHYEGSAIVVLVSYTRKRLRRTLELGDMRVQSGDLGIWGGQPK